MGHRGQLGHGDLWQGRCDLWQPTKIEAFAGQSVVAVTDGRRHNLAAITADGAVWSWGDGEYGKLGHGDQQNQWQPKKIEAFAGQSIVAVSAGGDHSFAITADGAVWSWGGGGEGRLGHGNQQNRQLPKKVEAFAGRRVVTVSAGSFHSLAITADGAAWSWGHGAFGKLGHGDEERQLLPKKVEALAGRRTVAVSAGTHHSIALTADGGVWSWGSGTFGKLGHGDLQRQQLPKKVEALAGRRVVEVSAGDNHSLATTGDSAIFTWGRGGRGYLGNGDDLTNQLLPQKIEAGPVCRRRC